MIMNILKGYKTSRDYKRLVELMKRQSVICIVDYNGERVVTNTTYLPDSPSGTPYHIGPFLYADSEKWLKRVCREANVEFIEPEEES